MEKLERNTLEGRVRIWIRWRSGTKLKTIANEEGVSKERIRSIKNHGKRDFNWQLANDFTACEYALARMIK